MLSVERWRVVKCKKQCQYRNDNEGYSGFHMCLPNRSGASPALTRRMTYGEGLMCSTKCEVARYP